MDVIFRPLLAPHEIRVHVDVTSDVCGLLQADLRAARELGRDRILVQLFHGDARRRLVQYFLPIGIGGTLTEPSLGLQAKDQGKASKQGFKAHCLPLVAIPLL